ncbi:MAG: hypothetical protein ACKOAH_22105, partial [Pirellula sp.]
LAAGNHKIFDPWYKTQVRIASTQDPWINERQLYTIVKSGKLEGHAVVLDLLDYQRALVWIDGRLSRMLGPGLFADSHLGLVPWVEDLVIACGKQVLELAVAENQSHFVLFDFDILVKHGLSPPLILANDRMKQINFWLDEECFQTNGCFGDHSWPCGDNLKRATCCSLEENLQSLPCCCRW